MRLRGPAVVTNYAVTLCLASPRLLAQGAATGGQLVPYRDSTLTWLLKEALGGSTAWSKRLELAAAHAPPPPLQKPTRAQGCPLGSRVRPRHLDAEQRLRRSRPKSPIPLASPI